MRNQKGTNDMRKVVPGIIRQLHGLAVAKTVGERLITAESGKHGV